MPAPEEALSAGNITFTGYEGAEINAYQALTAGAGPFPHWALDFDYLYVVGQPSANALPSLLEPLRAGRRFMLYRIRKTER